mmetsp:Transcript_12722/g.32995  ORF Transcript_12722/g.32995 Transcript_12722/m.32995 type:complete len:202 (-) Transcript_12722:272-877(-)
MLRNSDVKSEVTTRSAAIQAKSRIFSFAKMHRFRAQGFGMEATDPVVVQQLRLVSPPRSWARQATRQERARLQIARVVVVSLDDTAAHQPALLPVVGEASVARCLAQSQPNVGGALKGLTRGLQGPHRNLPTRRHMMAIHRLLVTEGTTDGAKATGFFVVFLDRIVGVELARFRVKLASATIPAVGGALDISSLLRISARV